jgi:hypothetical protein
MGHSLRLGPALCWLALSAPALADTSPTTQDLYLDPAWLTLMHYQQDTLGGGFTSLADDPDFFLSDQGKQAPERELEATLSAIQQPGSGGGHAQCRFPPPAQLGFRDS